MDGMIGLCEVVGLCDDVDDDCDDDVVGIFIDGGFSDVVDFADDIVDFPDDVVDFADDVDSTAVVVDSFIDVVDFPLASLTSTHSTSLVSSSSTANKSDARAEPAICAISILMRGRSDVIESTSLSRNPNAASAAASRAVPAQMCSWSKWFMMRRVNPRVNTPQSTALRCLGARGASMGRL